MPVIVSARLPRVVGLMGSRRAGRRLSSAGCGADFLAGLIGDVKVAATTAEIRVTFSKDMAAKSWSWVQLSKESFPKISGKPRFLKDKRTCVVDVKLEPGRTYALWLNKDKFTGFRDTAGKASVPYLLVFTTR